MCLNGSRQPIERFGIGAEASTCSRGLITNPCELRIQSLRCIQVQGQSWAGEAPGWGSQEAQGWVRVGNVRCQGSVSTIFTTLFRRLAHLEGKSQIWSSRYPAPKESGVQVRVRGRPAARGMTPCAAGYEQERNSFVMHLVCMADPLVCVRAHRATYSAQPKLWNAAVEIQRENTSTVNLIAMALRLQGARHISEALRSETEKGQNNLTADPRTAPHNSRQTQAKPALQNMSKGGFEV